MNRSGLGFLVEALHTIPEGVCAACGQPLPAGRRDYALTCNRVCHAVWIDALVARYGPTKRVTDLRTGKTYLVPTRVILETGIKTADLPQYPEAP